MRKKTLLDELAMACPLAWERGTITGGVGGEYEKDAKRRYEWAEAMLAEGERAAERVEARVA